MAAPIGKCSCGFSLTTDHWPLTTALSLLPPQHPSNPLIVIHGSILNHNLPLAMPVSNPNPHPQSPLHIRLCRPHIRILPPRPTFFLLLSRQGLPRQHRK